MLPYRRLPIEIEAPEQLGYDRVRYNLTESSYTDAQLGGLDLDLNEVILCYGDHLGLPALREQIVADSAPLQASQVMTTVGAASALFIVASSLLEKGDSLLVLRPNYMTNIETPRLLGADIQYLDLHFEKGYQIDLDELRDRLSPKTKLISLTYPHNPTGAHLCLADLKQIITWAETFDAYILLDETYREMAFDAPLPIGASLSPRVISVSSLSKTFGLPGIRLGWLICQDKALMQTFLAAKEQIFITHSVVDEHIAQQYLQRKADFLPTIRSNIQRRLGILEQWMQQQAGLEWVPPQAGVVCFPRIVAPQRLNITAFYRLLNEKYETFVGPGHWFEQPAHYMRIGFGYPDDAQLEQGLANISAALRDLQS